LAPPWVAVVLVVVLDGVALAWEPRGLRPDVVDVSPCVAVVPGVWSPATFFDPDVVVGVCDPTSWVLRDARCTGCTGEGPVSRARTTTSAPSMAPAAPRYRHLGIRFDSAIDEFSLRETFRTGSPGSLCGNAFSLKNFVRQLTERRAVQSCKKV
jgi:hypothetical protein